MITALDIKGFRCFERLRVAALGRVNLIVGLNNAGKTTLLEAVEAVATGTVAGLLRGPRRREELVDIRDDDDISSRRTPYRTDVSHLFWGHRLAPDTGLSIVAEGDSPGATARRNVSCHVDQLVLEPGGPSDALGEEGDLRLQLSFQSDKLEKPIQLELSAAGGIAWRIVNSPTEPEAPPIPVKFANLDARALAQLWDEIALTPEQDQVLEALRIIEPRTDGVAFLSSLRLARQGAILVKLAGESRRLPLGSLGDGLRRLLALSLHLVNSAGGVLLVDELDTGLHHSVMKKMWQLVIETAQRLDVQVFATTHSDDCWKALGRAVDEQPQLAADVSLHRIGRGAEQTIRYGAEDIVISARHDVEVR